MTIGRGLVVGPTPPSGAGGRDGGGLAAAARPSVGPTMAEGGERGEENLIKRDRKGGFTIRRIAPLHCAAKIKTDPVFVTMQQGNATKLATGERERAEIKERIIKVAVQSLITLHGGRKGRVKDKRGVRSKTENLYKNCRGKKSGCTISTWRELHELVREEGDKEERETRKKTMCTY